MKVRGRFFEKRRVCFTLLRSETHQQLQKIHLLPQEAFSPHRPEADIRRSATVWRWVGR